MGSDQAIKSFAFTAVGVCKSENIRLLGAKHHVPWADKQLIEDCGLDADVAAHMHHAYGDQAPRVALLALLAKSGLGARLHPDHPYIEAEVIYAVRNEFAERACDVLSRRLPLALLDNAAASSVVSHVVNLIAKENSWSLARCEEETALCMQRLEVAICKLSVQYSFRANNSKTKIIYFDNKNLLFHSNALALARECPEQWTVIFLLASGRRYYGFIWRVYTPVSGNRYHMLSRPD